MKLLAIVYVFFITSCGHKAIEKQRFVASETQIISQMQSKLSSSNKGVHTDVVLVYKDGQKIYEYFDRGYDLKSKHLSWSMAKSIAGILIGQAIDEKKLNLDDKVSKYIPQFPTQATIKNLLQMSSGIDFHEVYSGIPVTADVTKMLYLDGPKNGFSEYVTSLTKRVNNAPGDHFYYSSGDTNVLMAILKKVYPSNEDYNLLPWTKLFFPLGIKDASFEQDSKGVFVGSSYIYMNPEDYLKIGLLISNNGIWQGQRIIPESYFELMTQVSDAVNAVALDPDSQTRAYSSQITTNLPIVDREKKSDYPYLPTDALIMVGHQGQYLISSPSQKLVIVRLGTDEGEEFDIDGFLKLAGDLIRSKGYELTVAADYQRTFNSIEQNENKQKTRLKDYFKIPHLIRAMASKEYCSCRNVLKRTDKQCKEDLKITLPVLPKLSISKDSRHFTAKLGTGLFGKISRSEYKGEKLGCVLIQSE